MKEKLASFVASFGLPRLIISAFLLALFILAVIESELERLSDKLDEVAARKIRPQDKIIELIYTHLSMIRETVVRNGNLRAEFFRNIWMVAAV